MRTIASSGTILKKTSKLSVLATVWALWLELHSVCDVHGRVWAWMMNFLDRKTTKRRFAYVLMVRWTRPIRLFAGFEPLLVNGWPCRGEILGLKTCILSDVFIIFCQFYSTPFFLLLSFFFFFCEESNLYREKHQDLYDFFGDLR